MVLVPETGTTGRRVGLDGEDREVSLDVLITGNQMM
jgi:hypothetical protein